MNSTINEAPGLLQRVSLAWGSTRSSDLTDAPRGKIVLVDYWLPELRRKIRR